MFKYIFKNKRLIISFFANLLLMIMVVTNSQPHLSERIIISSILFLYWQRMIYFYKRYDELQNKRIPNNIN